MTRARRSAGPLLVIAVAFGVPTTVRAAPGVAVPDVSIRAAGNRTLGGGAEAQEQPAGRVTFVIRIANTGDAAGSFTVQGDHGGAVFSLRYLAGGSGDERITSRVVAGTYVLEDVPPGETRTVRMVVRVRADAPIDRRGSWSVEAMSPDATDDVRGAVRTVTPLFARAAGVALHVPAADALGVTYHESLFGSASALRPIGRLLESRHPSFDPPPDRPGPAYLVMASRGRGTPPTSASDDVLARGEPVLAPVTGRVIRVTSYRLYCDMADVRIAIRPAEAPERTVQVFHVADPRVHRGHRVLVSHTVLGRPRRFPFHTQTQDYGLPGRHVHLEIEHDGSTPRPGCAAASALGTAISARDDL